MRKLTLASCAALMSIGMASAVSATTVRIAPTISHPPYRGYYVVRTPRGVTSETISHQVPAQTTIPYFTDSIKSPINGQTYSFQIAGTNPLNNKVSTSIQFVPVIMRVHFPNGVVLDPTKPGCNDNEPVAERFFASPLFQDDELTSNGVDVGDTQLTDGFMRSEFWDVVHGSNYHVLLSRSGPYNIVDVTAPSGSITQPGVCAGSGHDLGEIDINAYDSIIQQLATQYSQVNQVPVTFSYNVVETEGGGCCVLGYHSDFNRNGGIQVYATGAYTDPGLFEGTLEDIAVYTHELAELFNDPFIDNFVPAWGHIGQQPGCQNNFEVGDPLTGTDYSLPFNGFTYHPQELAFFGWFYRLTPSYGTGGKYSNQGTFTNYQQICT